MKGRKPQTIVKVEDNLDVVPDAPIWLSPEAKTEWRKVAAILVERGVLTSADLGTLAAYCSAVGQLVVAERAIRRDGMVVGDKRHPLLTTSVAARNQIRQLAGELGLTPVSRSRPAIREDDDADSLLDI